MYGASSISLTIALLATFSLYGCEIYATYNGSATGDELLLSWLWSMGQRFLLHEPFLILAAKGLPMLFASEFCSNICSESLIAFLSVLAEAAVAFCKSLRP